MFTCGRVGMCDCRWVMPETGLTVRVPVVLFDDHALFKRRHQPCHEICHWFDGQLWRRRSFQRHCDKPRRLLSLPLGGPKQPGKIDARCLRPPRHPCQTSTGREHTIAMAGRQFEVPVDKQHTERSPLTPELLASPAPSTPGNAKAPAASPRCLDKVGPGRAQRLDQAAIPVRRHAERRRWSNPFQRIALWRGTFS